MRCSLAPAATLNVLDLGAVGDGATKDAAAIAKAIAAVNGAGGGTLVPFDEMVKMEDVSDVDVTGPSERRGQQVQKDFP